VSSASPVLLDNGLSLQVRSTGAVGWIIGLFDALGLGAVDPNSKGPRGVLVNEAHREHVIKQYMSIRQAARDLPRIKADIDQTGYFSWAERAGIPPHFEIMQPE
jgi:hypothetical protein